MKAMAAVAASVDEAPRSRFAPRVWPRRRPEPVAKKAAPETDDIEPTIYRFIFKHSLRQQIMLLALTLASFPFLYYSLQLPKDIINNAIRESAKFPQSILGIEFDRVPL